MSYENPWTFKDKIFDTEDIRDYEGFVYLITNVKTGRKYIGKKFFYSIRKVKGKKKRQRLESDWKKYYGSSIIVKEEVKTYGIENFKRQIISLHISRGDTNYSEVREQVLRDVLEDETYYNDAIGKYRRTSDRIIMGRQHDKNLHKTA